MGKAHTLGPGSLKIGLTASPREFAAQMTKAELTPSTDADDTLSFLDGSEAAGEDKTTWVFGGTIAQDYDLNSLEIYCADNAGKEFPFVFTPNDLNAVDWSGTVKIRPVKIGGEVKKRNTSDFEFPVIGKPTHSGS